jgi:hypothetical protein
MGRRENRFYRSRATARELSDVDTTPRAVACPVRFSGGVLASARTVTGATVAILIVRGVLTENY